MDLKRGNRFFGGWFLAVTSSGPGGLMFLVVLWLGAPEGSSGSGSDFKAFQKMGPRLKISSDRLGEPEIKLRTPGYKASDLSTTPE